MESPSALDVSPLEFAMPVPSPVRALFYFILTSMLTASMYVCIQAALMIHAFYETLQWVGEVANQ